MKNKYIILLALCFLSFFATAQNTKESTVKKIKTFIYQYSVSPETNKTGKKAVVYFNKVDEILDIDGHQIPLQEVKTTYYYSKDFRNHCVSFNCISGDCIINPQGEYMDGGFAAPFLNKKYCYEFMELINQLKR